MKVPCSRRKLVATSMVFDQTGPASGWPTWYKPGLEMIPELWRRNAVVPDLPVLFWEHFLHLLSGNNCFFMMLFQQSQMQHLDINWHPRHKTLQSGVTMVPRFQQIAKTTLTLEEMSSNWETVWWFYLTPSEEVKASISDDHLKSELVFWKNHFHLKVSCLCQAVSAQWILWCYTYTVYMHYRCTHRCACVCVCARFLWNGFKPFWKTQSQKKKKNQLPVNFGMDIFQVNTISFQVKRQSVKEQSRSSCVKKCSSESAYLTWLHYRQDVFST